MHLILQFRFFIFKTDVDTFSSSFFRHKIHCGHLFLLQNVKIKQFVNFSLRVGGRLLKYLYGLKMCVMSMFFLLIYNKRQTLMLVDSEYFHVPLVPMFLINCQGYNGTVSHSCWSNVGLPCSGSLSPVDSYAC